MKIKVCAAAEGANLVKGLELRSCEEGFQAMEGCPNPHSSHIQPEVQLPHITTRIHKGMCVLLHKKVLQHSALGHQPEQVEVTSEELASSLPNPRSVAAHSLKKMTSTDLTVQQTAARTEGRRPEYESHMESRVCASATIRVNPKFFYLVSLVRFHHRNTTPELTNMSMEAY